MSTSPANRRIKSMTLPVGFSRIGPGQYKAPKGIFITNKPSGFEVSHNYRVLGVVPSFEAAVLAIDLVIGVQS